MFRFIIFVLIIHYAFCFCYYQYLEKVVNFNRLKVHGENEISILDVSFD